MNTSCHAPGKYIYAPWTAPLEVQKAAGCIIGKDLDGWLLMGLVEDDVVSANGAGLP